MGSKPILQKRAGGHVQRARRRLEALAIGAVARVPFATDTERTQIGALVRRLARSAAASATSSLTHHTVPVRGAPGHFVVSRHRPLLKDPPMTTTHPTATDTELLLDLVRNSQPIRIGSHARCGAVNLVVTAGDVLVVGENDPADVVTRTVGAFHFPDEEAQAEALALRILANPAEALKSQEHAVRGWFKPDAPEVIRERALAAAAQWRRSPANAPRRPRPN